MIKSFFESRYPLALGAFLGFIIVAIINYINNSPFNILLESAAIASIAGALLAKILLSLLASALKSSMRDKQSNLNSFE